MKSRRIELVGSAGAAGGTAHFGVGPSALRGVQVKYLSQPGTVDVVLTGQLDGVDKQVLSLSNSGVDFPLTPVLQDAVGSAGAPTTDPAKIFPVLCGELAAVVTQGDPANPGVVVTVLLEV